MSKQFDSSPEPTTFSGKMAAFFSSLNCCGGSADDEDDDSSSSSPRTIQIVRPQPSPALFPQYQEPSTNSPLQSAPTDFRREDISMPGLSASQQASIREKARLDATRMWHSLQPLASSPSTQFASRPLPTYEQFVTPRPAPASPALGDAGTGTGTGRRGSHGWGGSIRAHSRKISDALSKPLGYEKVVGGREGGGGLEMRGLMDVGVGKGSAESWSVAGSDLGEAVVGAGAGRKI